MAAVESKILKKKKSNEWCLKLLEECKKHGGPITSSDKDVRRLQALSKKELLNEIRYLRMTIAPNIKEKRRVQSGDKYKFECFTEEELRKQIKEVIRPESSADQSKEKLDEMLQSVLMETWNTRRRMKQTTKQVKTRKQ